MSKDWLHCGLVFPINLRMSLPSHSGIYSKESEIHAASDIRIYVQTHLGIKYYKCAKYYIAQKFV